jgi:hypothetical protein
MACSSLEAAFERREPAPRWQAWLETAGLAVAALALGALVDARDPFLLNPAFPWLALAPMLAGLRYGAGHGVVCSAFQVLALTIAWSWGKASVPWSMAEVALGWLVAGLASGKFRDAWLRRGCQLEASADELRLRLEGLARAYHALKLSHERLQRELPGSPSSLCDALDDLRRELLEPRGAESVEALGGRVLAFFGEHASARSATLHLVDRGGRPGPAVAALGAVAVVEDDPIVGHASRLGEIASVRDIPAQSQVLAAIPLVDVGGRVHAVVAIHDMPFVTLHAETLALLGVLGGQLGDVISRALTSTAPARVIHRLQRAAPTTSADVARRLRGVGP